jgi:hypothetical protein
MMRWEGNARTNTPSASALQMLKIGAEILLGIKWLVLALVQGWR